MSDEMSKAGDVVAAPERGGAIALALGLALFGFAIGFTTAISRHEGISGQLLGGLFSFVGGSLLTYGGFRYVRRGKGGASVVLSPSRIGLGLVGFSLGVVGGQHGGIAYRSWEGIRIAREQLAACVAKAREGPNEHRVALEESCYGIHSGKPPAAEPPATLERGHSDPTADSGGAGHGPRASRSADGRRPSAPKDSGRTPVGALPARMATETAASKAASSLERPGAAMVSTRLDGPPDWALAATHSSGAAASPDAREQCRRNKRDLLGGVWATDDSPVAAAFREMVKALNCEAL